MDKLILAKYFFGYRTQNDISLRKSGNRGRAETHKSRYRLDDISGNGTFHRVWAPISCLTHELAPSMRTYSGCFSICMHSRDRFLRTRRVCGRD